jgi:hypothetical protein
MTKNADSGFCRASAVSDWARAETARVFGVEPMSDDEPFTTTVGNTRWLIKMAGDMAQAMTLRAIRQGRLKDYKYVPPGENEGR